MEYLPITMCCQNCGGKLEAGWDHNTGTSMVIEGAYPMKFRHISGKLECRPRTQFATAYSIWDANKALKRAESQD